MRLPLCFASLILLLSVGGSAAASEAGLVAHWPFEDGGGSVAMDIAGNGLDGTLLGSPLFTEGVLGAP